VLVSTGRQCGDQPILNFLIISVFTAIGWYHDNGNDSFSRHNDLHPQAASLHSSMPQYIKLPLDAVGLWPKRLTASHRRSHHRHLTTPRSSQTNNAPQQQPSTPTTTPSNQQKSTSAPWRTRPDFQPQQQRIGIQDIDLNTALLPDTGRGSEFITLLLVIVVIVDRYRCC